MIAMAIVPPTNPTCDTAHGNDRHPGPIYDMHDKETCLRQNMLL